MNAILCIFARVPVLGAVKTRLAVELGERAALDAHLRLVEDALARLRAIDGTTTELWVDRPGHPDAVRWASRYGVSLQIQSGVDLGERMDRALQYCHARGRRGLVVGTDCPTIGPDYVTAALAALDAHDVVLGPAQDGGYGLIGARGPVPELFRTIPWGTSGVYAATIAAANEAGLSVASLDEIWDVDTAADWRRYLALRES